MYTLSAGFSCLGKTLGLIFVCTLLLSSCRKKTDPVDPITPPPTTPPTLEVTTLLTGYEIIWGMDFLPNGDMLFAEKRGRLFRFSNGTVTEITGFPTVRSTGQGGLLDIRVHPGHASNGWVYACHAATSTAGNGELRLVRFKIAGNTVQGLETIFTTGGGNTWNGHYGSRILFDKSGLLWLSVGEGGAGSYGGPTASNRNASDAASRWGKIHRMTDAGGIPADNPVLPGQSAATTAFAYGVRNPQGMALHPVTGEVWENEHGPKGGDEINIISKGAHYGWPQYSIGVNYDNSQISQGHVAAGIAPPIYTWTPSIGVCGAAFITADAFKSWKGSLLVGGLASQKLYRCVVDGVKVVSEEVVPGVSGRVRNVVQGSDGAVYVSVEGPGRILRIRGS
jgi:glucose/arabinose dehydrogenase